MFYHRKHFKKTHYCNTVTVDIERLPPKLLLRKLKTAKANQVPAQRSELKLIWLPHSFQTMGARERELALGGQRTNIMGGISPQQTMIEQFLLIVTELENKL